jgi:TolA-binding protein
VITAQETGSVTKGAATAVSAVTKGLVSDTVRSSITEFENRRNLADAASDARMTRLEQQVGDIDHQVKQMATQMQKVIVDELTASEARQHAHTARQDTKIDRLESIVEKMATSIRELLADNHAHNDGDFYSAQSHNNTPMNSPDRPSCSPRERETSTDGTTSDRCSSPDRQKQKLNQGVPTESGTGTRAE